MALFDIFKKKKKPEKKKPEKIIRKKPLTSPVKPKGVCEFAYRVLEKPQVTEKASDLTKKNQYVFKIFATANKTDVKKAVESTYGVDVESVKIINLFGKKRRLGRIEGWRPGAKKAVVRIKEGQKIEILPR